MQYLRTAGFSGLIFALAVLSAPGFGQAADAGNTSAKPGKPAAQTDKPAPPKPVPPRDPKEEKERRQRVTLALTPIAALESELKITPEQRTKMVAIRNRLEADMNALRKSATPGAPNLELGKKYVALMEQAGKDVEAGLTPEQQARIPYMFEKLGLLRSLDIPLTMVGELNLTDAQKKQIEGIYKAARDKYNALTPDEQKKQADSIRKDAHDKAMAVLTAEQKTAIEKYKQAHPARTRPAN